MVGYGVTYLVRFMPGMLELAMTIGGVTNGPIIGVFAMGMLLPWVSERGALVGFFSGVILSSWVAGGATIYRQHLGYTSTSSPPMPSDTSQCPEAWLSSMNNETTMSSASMDTPPEYLPLYELSYIWYSLLGMGLTMVTGLLTSLIWSQDVTKLDKSLLSPAIPSMIKVSGVRNILMTRLVITLIECKQTLLPYPVKGNCRELQR